MSIVKRKHVVDKGLSITSLLDVLTIILAFLLKNVSMEANKVSQVEGMVYPTTTTVEKLAEGTEVVPIKIYMDKVLMGVDNSLLGTPYDLINTPEKRQSMQDYLNEEISAMDEDKQGNACLVVQADSNIPCIYITQIVSVGTSVGYQNIYFASLEDADWLKNYSPSSTQ